MPLIAKATIERWSLNRFDVPTLLTVLRYGVCSIQNMTAMTDPFARVWPPRNAFPESKAVAGMALNQLYCYAS